MMKIQEGKVKYMDRDDRIKYGVTDEGKQYYFLDKEDNKKLSNNGRIASTDLKEAVDPLYASEHAKNVGVVGEDGNEIIPFINKSIKEVNDDIVLVEPAEPISQSVKDVVQLKKTDPLAATKLVPTPALIKNKMNEKMGNAGRYVFNNQFSEATLVDVNGNNVVNNEYYSFIATTPDKIYFSKNTTDSVIGEYALGQSQVTEEQAVPVAENTQLDVTNVNVDPNVVENALANEQAVVEQPVAEPSAVGFDNTTVTPNVNEGFASSEVTPVALSNEQIPDTAVNEVAPIAPPVAEVPVDDAIEETVVAGDPTVPEQPIAEETQNVDVAPIAPVAEVAEETPAETVQEENDEIVIPQIDADDAVEETVTETPVEDTVEETVTETPAEDTVEEEVAETPVEDTVEETVAETPVEDTVEEVTETPVEDTVEETVAETPTEDTVEEEVTETPVEDDVQEEVPEASEDIDLNDDMEDTTLDNMFNEVSNARDVEDDMNEDIFSTSIKTDSIDIDDEFDEKYDTNDYSVDSYKSDNFTDEAYKTIVELINQNKELNNSNKELKNANNKLVMRAERAEAKAENAIEIVKASKEKTSIITAENKRLKSNVIKLNTQNESLENDVNELRRVNSSQSREIEELHRKLKGREEDLSKVIQEAKKVLLENDNTSYGYDDEDTYYRRAA